MSIHMTVAEKQENVVRKKFDAPKHRRKNRAVFFRYLLLDPRNIRDITKCTICEFVNAIFYIGKGTKKLPAQHLKDAINRAEDIANGTKVWLAFWRTTNSG